MHDDTTHNDNTPDTTDDTTPGLDACVPALREAERLEAGLLPPALLSRLGLYLHRDTRFAAFVAASPCKPQRHQSRREQRLLRTLLARRWLELHHHASRDPVARTSLIVRITGTGLADASQSHARLLRLSDSDNRSRIIADKRERVVAWIDALANRRRHPAVRYMLWRSVLTTARHLERANPLPPPHRALIDVLERIVIATDRSADAITAIEGVMTREPLFAGVVADPLALVATLERLVAAAHPFNGSLTNLYLRLLDIHDHPVWPHRRLPGCWLTCSPRGITGRLPPTLRAQFGSVLRSPDTARAVAVLTRDTEWCINTRATAAAYLARGRLLLYCVRFEHGWRPALGIVCDGHHAEAPLLNVYGTGISQTVALPLAHVLAARPEIPRQVHAACADDPLRILEHYNWRP